MDGLLRRTDVLKDGHSPTGGWIDWWVSGLCTLAHRLTYGLVYLWMNWLVNGSMNGSADRLVDQSIDRWID